MACYKEQLIDRLRQFIRIPSRSSSAGGEEGVLQHLIASEMSRLGARVAVLKESDVAGFRTHSLCHGPNRNYSGRPTVIGELGPTHGPALLVLAHSDTVQVYQPDLWTLDPFSGELRDGSIYGLGASDDKWGLAAMLTMMQAVQDSGLAPRKKLIFASTIDEENGVGNGTLLLHLSGVRAEAALYLDGANMEINVGCLGGSNLYLDPIKTLSPERILRDFTSLTDACKTFSRQRIPLFNRPYYERNAVEDCSVQVIQRRDDAGVRLVVSFYTLPDERATEFCGQLESVVEDALGAHILDYRRNYRQPWFEAAFVSPQMPLVKYLTASLTEIFGEPPNITTISKQDSFVLTNHSDIPTISFGCTRRFNQRGAFHNPDERLEVDELWNGFRAAYGAVCRWLEGD
ncbi:MAG TPA: M20/M25/M40 family metallo-hydrolase [Candidatus Dormibacteraeota bacterium]|nr:M20/M25/M40 family metallo-hydrolase [Candidatus Dormibacteraeota bacterium]